MLSAPEQSVCAALAARDAAMRQDLAAHVAIPTGHNHRPGLDAYRGLLLDRLTALGGQAEFVPGTPRPWWISGPNGKPTQESHIPPTVIVRKAGTLPAGGQRVMLAGHLDTVFPPDGRFASLSVAPDGQTAIGPGVVDMKGGILIAINALEALAEIGIDLPWTFCLNSDEETGSYHSQAALRMAAREADIGLALEPALPDGSLAVQRKGSAQFYIEAQGRSAHAGRDFASGISAVYALAEAMLKVERLIDLERGLTVNVGPLKGGAVTNAVPDRAAAWGNVRYPTPEDGEAFQRAMASLAGQDARGAQIIVEQSFNRPAKPMTPATMALAEHARATAEALGQTLPFASTGGVCDGNILQDAGLPTIDTLGVRGGGLHTEQEWIDLRSLVERSQLLACLILRLAGLTNR
jgi:glutamate carboxypeptidase